MIPQNEAKIFPAKQREVTACDQLISRSSFNTTYNNNLHIEPFLSLKDIVLAPGKSVKFAAEENIEIMLLPVAGTILYNYCGEKNIAIEPGKLQVITLRQDDSVEILNTYEELFINFLELWIKPEVLNTSAKTISDSFEINLTKNTLVRILNDKMNDASIKFYIGKFDGRKDALYQLSKPGNSLLVFIIEGAFEVQYRLLETRDALLLRNLATADIEALSNDAVILIAELPA